ncbi:hypothetical protein [Brevundimonas sp.]|uniref:hypothetical protein n=1 Tax=Brevundimonas sp. TaxID=1871086 RepID=UPI003D6D6CEA
MTDLRVQPAPRLNEINWFWRRLWSFSVTFVALAIVGGVVWTLRAPHISAGQAMALQSIAYGLIGTVVFVGLIYVVGATTYELAQLAAARRVDVARAGVGIPADQA